MLPHLKVLGHLPLRIADQIVRIERRKMKSEECKKLALSLLHADSVLEVEKILREQGFWDDPNAWRLLGDRDGNWATIGNQAARPEAALVEKLINSVDARLMNECLVQGINPESPKAPASMKHAISVLIDGADVSSASEASIAKWTSKKQLEQARHITLAVTGKMPKDGSACLTIVDSGEGQTPSKFPDTFLSIDKNNKLRIPFVQGKFNMGGTGALRSCTHGIQVILSRRNPAILTKWRGTGKAWDSNDPRDDQWGFTVVRREFPQGNAGEIRNSVFRYLAPVTSGTEKHQVLSFASDTLQLFPDDDRPYEREASYGTAIKLFEYDMKGFRSRALSELLPRLEVLLPNVALPIRMHECRGYGGKKGSYATNLVGLTVRLGENKGENLEEGYPTSVSFVVKGEAMTADIFAFKPGRDKNYRTVEGIIFSMNGQTHGYERKNFFQRAKVGMGRLANSLLIVVDCTHISVGARENLFMNSRDRLSDGELAKEIIESLEDSVRQHPGLRALRDKRVSEEIAERLQESKPLENILDSILKSSPSLTKLFVFGQRLNRPHRADIDTKTEGGGQGNQEGRGTFESKPHPTYFKFHKMKGGETLQRNSEQGRRCRIRFDTDASNDYFERTSFRGRYEVEVLDGPIAGIALNHSLTIHDGIANWSIKFPDDESDVGDTLTIQCTVTDDTLLEPLVNVAKITLIKFDEHDNGKKDGKRKGGASGGQNGEGGTGNIGKGGNASTQGLGNSGGIDMPRMVPVHRDDPIWVEQEFDDNTACTVINDGDDVQPKYVFYINVDNIFLLTDLKTAKGNAALRNKKFIWGNVLVGLALIHDSKLSKQKTIRHTAEDPTEMQETIGERVRKTTRALAPFLIPMIDYLGALTEDELFASAEGALE